MSIREKLYYYINLIIDEWEDGRYNKTIIQFNSLIRTNMYKLIYICLDNKGKLTFIMIDDMESKNTEYSNFVIDGLNIGELTEICIKLIEEGYSISFPTFEICRI